MTEKLKIFQLRSENLTNLGGPMGTENTFDNFNKPFQTLESAKAYAEKDYGKPIEWIQEKNYVRSPDLAWVMYHIKEVEVL